MLVGHYAIEQVQTDAEAERIVDFLLSDQSFDDTRYTPGELLHFRQLPFRALKKELLFWFVADESGRIAGINCVAENEQKTGGYSWDYIVVHREHRKTGIASAMIEEMLVHLSLMGARYLVTYTCDLPEYAPIRRLFEQHGFMLVGRCPDYYYAGEDRLIYYRKLD